MSVVEPGPMTSGLVDRVKAILVRPSETWDVIEGEPATVGGLYKGYIIPLAAIPAVATLIGSLVFGYGLFGVVYRPSLIGALVQALVSYGLALAMVYVLALVIDALASSFEGQKNQIQALKVAAYSYTAAWVAGIFGVFPPIALLALLGGLYSLYLLYLGLPKLMKVPAEKALPYTAVTVVVAIVLSMVIGLVAGGLAGAGAVGSGLMADRGSVSGTVRTPGGTLDLGKLEEASKQMEAAARQMERGEGPPATDPEVLKTYLPDAVAGFSRTEVTSASGGVGGMTGSSAEGAYEKGDARLRLSVADLGAAGALAGLAEAFNVQSSSERDGAYEKVGRVDGRMTQERYDAAARHGEYSVLVGNRFLVSAEGDGVAMADLKAAAASVGFSKLEALAR
jgi:hypothetical protein